MAEEKNNTGEENKKEKEKENIAEADRSPDYGKDVDKRRKAVLEKEKSTHSVW